MTGGASDRPPATCRQRGLGVRQARREKRGLDRRVGHLRRISDAPIPATAPRPASGDADQTPLGNEAG